MGTIVHDKSPDNSGNPASEEKKVRDRNEASASPTRPEHRGVSRRSVIDEAKRLVPTIDLADLLLGAGKMRRMGVEWVARCPLPEHEDKTPSFAVNPEKNAFFCHGCLRGGDAVELARHAWGYDQRDAHMAAADLLRTFGHDIPARPAAWHRKQERQQPVRDAIDEARRNVYRRRIFKVYILPLLEGVEDQDEYAKEAKRAWRDIKELIR